MFENFFLILNMVKLTDEVYKQDYFCEDFFLLVRTLSLEAARLNRLGVKILDHKLSIAIRNDSPLFYLHLYFKSRAGLELVEDDLFGNI